jgi:Rrf2 family transcriptional regulator, iron-sulfur cluster assembly transcription factor
LKLSTKGRYGLRAFIDIAIFGENEPVSLAHVAKRQDISISYLEQLMVKLKKAELIVSIRGANGGYEIAKDRGRISVGDVLRALEGDLAPVDCAAFHEGNHACAASDDCASKIVWKKINDSINETVNNIYIDELVADSKSKNTNREVIITCKM